MALSTEPGKSFEVAGIDCDQASFCQLQRWRYANVDKQTGPACLVDAEMQLAGCGDWFRRGRVEAAFSSGLEVGVKLRERSKRRKIS